jgi:hypothetical protein
LILKVRAPIGNVIEYSFLETIEGRLTEAVLDSARAVDANQALGEAEDIAGVVPARGHDTSDCGSQADSSRNKHNTALGNRGCT